MAVPPAYLESLPSPALHHVRTLWLTLVFSPLSTDIDPEPSPEALAAARALISAEQTASEPPSLPPLREPSFSSALTTELARVASSTPLQPLSLSRYEAQELPPAPASAPAASTRRSRRGSASSTAAARAASSYINDELRPVLSNAYVSAAYLAARNQNLALLDRHGANAWLLSNYHLEESLRAVERDLADVKRDMDLVNAARQRRQEDVRAEMLMLEESWRKGVGRVLETEVAVEELKAQVREELKNRSAQHDL
ncbi:BCAS2 family protein [Purpureocillium lavendulum]|uniref:BCAS2 family protein n=1 Tax=Purpureocillium lavendulum TaxID=1247861 RepID=A0AB34FVE6_9HYPO|nr:BCAS2 family protein [Purpureocillium lavendulum]